MADPLRALKELAYLAHEHKDEQSRRTLLRRVTEVFLDAPESFTDRQSQYFGDIMEALAYDLEQQVREELSRRIAAEAAAPRTLVRRLACDEISVACPVLQHSPALTECDLVELSRHGSQDHLLAMTKRDCIGARLSAALVDRGQDEVVESLVRNETATIAEETVQRVAERARDSEPLQTALIDRKDVPRDIMIGLLEHVSDKVRHAILEGAGDSDVDTLDEVVRSMKAEIASGGKSQSERYVENLERRGALDEQALLRFAFENRPMEFVLGLARLLKVDVPTVRRIFMDPSGQALLVSCRASGFSVEAFKEIALSPVTGNALDLHQVRPLVRIYRRLTVSNAQRAMRYWRTRTFAAQAEEDRRSGRDTRSEAEKRRVGERRSGWDRRADATRMPAV